MNRGNWIKNNVASQGGCPKCSGGTGEICADCLQGEIISQRPDPLKKAIDKETYRVNKRKEIRAGWKRNEWIWVGAAVLLIGWIIF